MRNIILCFAIFISSLSVQAQELNCSIFVDADQTGQPNQQVFTTLAEQLTEFVNTTKWTNKIYKNQERINCNMSIIISDYNNDTFLDVLVSAYSSNFIAWYANDGNGNFGTEQIIATVNGASGLFVGDIDNDTTPDIAVTAYDDDQVVWYANNGSGVFGAANILDNTLTKPGAVNMKDIDNDGDLDALVATAIYGGDVIEIFRNNLVPSGTVSFTKDVISVVLVYSTLLLLLALCFVTPLTASVKVCE